MFPGPKATLYQIHLQNISFDPKYSGNFAPSGTSQKAWNAGIQKLINFIEAKIEEYEIITEKRKKMSKKEDNIK